MYLHCIQALEQAVRLTPGKRLRICEEVYSEAKMLDDSVKEAENFLSRWTLSCQTFEALSVETIRCIVLCRSLRFLLASSVVLPGLFSLVVAQLAGLCSLCRASWHACRRPSFVFITKRVVAIAALTQGICTKELVY